MIYETFLRFFSFLKKRRWQRMRMKNNTQSESYEALKNTKQVCSRLPFLRNTTLSEHEPNSQENNFARTTVLHETFCFVCSSLDCLSILFLSGSCSIHLKTTFCYCLTEWPTQDCTPNKVSQQLMNHKMTQVGCHPGHHMHVDNHWTTWGRLTVLSLSLSPQTVWSSQSVVLRTLPKMLPQNNSRDSLPFVLQNEKHSLWSLSCFSLFLRLKSSPADTPLTVFHCISSHVFLAFQSTCSDAIRLSAQAWNVWHTSVSEVIFSTQQQIHLNNKYTTKQSQSWVHQILVCTFEQESCWVGFLFLFERVSWRISS